MVTVPNICYKGLVNTYSCLLLTIWLTYRPSLFHVSVLLVICWLVIAFGFCTLFTSYFGLFWFGTFGDNVSLCNSLHWCCVTDPPASVPLNIGRCMPPYQALHDVFIPVSNVVPYCLIIFLNCLFVPLFYTFRFFQLNKLFITKCK